MRSWDGCLSAPSAVVHVRRPAVAPGGAVIARAVVDALLAARARVGRDAAHINVAPTTRAKHVRVRITWSGMGLRM